MKYTHEGWFGFCPVYIADPYSRCPQLTHRQRWLKPVLHLNVFLQQTAIAMCSVMAPDWEPCWKIRLTGKLEKPVEV